VNADAIARALSPFHPERVAWKSGRLMLEAIHQLADSGEDFAFETTLASRSFVPFLRKYKARGYEVSLIFLWLRSATLAERRVAARVLSGGHRVPRQVIRRRYRAGIHNFWTRYVYLWQIIGLCMIIRDQLPTLWLVATVQSTSTSSKRASGIRSRV